VVKTTAPDPLLAPGEYLTPEEVTRILPGLTENALAVRRHRHQDPPFCRLGRTVLYPLRDLQAWIAASTVRGTRHGH
jgi:hypothetical protein